MATPNTTLRTVEDYIADARVLLQDETVPYRYGDTSLVTALNVTLLEVLRIRADLFIEYKFTPPTFSEVDATVVCIEAPFRLAVLFGLCSHAFLRDQEDIQDNRAAAFSGQMYDILIGSRARPLIAGALPSQGGGT